MEIKNVVGGVLSGWNALPVTGPKYFNYARGAYLYDIDENRLIDWLMGWGSLIFGHNPQFLSEVFNQALHLGFGFQGETTYHFELAKLLCSNIPCAEAVRLGNSGLEATLYALRLARAFTKRNKFIKFEGHFHGLHDSVLYDVLYSPRLGTIDSYGEVESIPGSPGIPGQYGDLIISLPFNDSQALDSAIQRHRGKIAAIIMEPIALNMGCVRPANGFIDQIKYVADSEGIVLIFDEVRTGFRSNFGGAQEELGIVPDLACFSKAMSGGFPVSAVVGKADIMKLLAPEGNVEMSGTNTGRMLSVLGTLNNLHEFQKNDVFGDLRKKSDYFKVSIYTLLDKYGITGYVDTYGGYLCIFLGLESQPQSLREIANFWDKQLHLAIYKEIVLTNELYGFFIPNDQSPEVICLSIEHSFDDINRTLNIFETAMNKVCNLSAKIT